MKSIPVSLLSPFPADECLARLRSEMDHEPPGPFTSNQAIPGSHEVIGHIEADRIVLRRRIPFSSLFQPVLTATLRAQVGGAVIEGGVAVHNAGRRFVRWGSIAAGFVGGVIFLGALLKLTQDQPPVGAWIGLLVLPGFALVAAWLRIASSRLLRHDTTFLTGHLTHTLDARPIHETF